VVLQPVDRAAHYRERRRKQRRRRRMRRMAAIVVLVLPLPSFLYSAGRILL